MITKENIKVISKTKGLDLSSWTVRHISDPDGTNKTTPHFQGIITNSTKGTVEDVEYSLRYFNRNEEFVGLDDGLSGLSADIGPQEDQTVNFELEVPTDATNAIFRVKGSRQNPLEKHSFVIFGVCLLGSAIVYGITSIL